MDADPTMQAELPDTDAAALERLKRFGGGKLLREMIALFLAAAPERIDAARGAGARGDASAVEAALHSLKSSSAQLGAMRMQRLSQQGEQRAHEGSIDDLSRLVAELDREFALVRTWLLVAADKGAA